MTGRRRDRAVVLGGGVAGLVAARVLADAYAEVVVVERDGLPAGPEPRRGVPQARHLHSLLARGQQVLDELFDGLTDELRDLGAPVGDMLGSTSVRFGGHRFRAAPSGLPAVFLSRALLESRLRARVRALPAVTLLDRRDVVGLVATGDRRRVRGVRVVRRGDGGAEEVLAADLVLDATGRGSRTPVWLEALGYPRPPVEQVRIGLGYATRCYRLAPGATRGALALLTAPTPQNPRGGALSAVEGGRHLLTLVGLLGDHPPTDPDGYAEFARTLGWSELAAALRDAEPLDAPVPYRHPVSVRHRYDRLRRLPAGLLVVGDALCSFNPVYGQGMSVAALQGLVLRRHLARNAEPRPGRFFREAARVVTPAWQLAVGGDLAFPEVDGRRTALTRAARRWVGLVQAGATDDPALGAAFLRVTGLVDPPRALLAPAVAVRVARAARRRAAGPPGRLSAATALPDARPSPEGAADDHLPDQRQPAGP